METVTLGPPLFLSSECQYCFPGGIGHCVGTLLVAILDCSLMILVALFPKGDQAVGTVAAFLWVII